MRHSRTLHGFIAVYFQNPPRRNFGVSWAAVIQGLRVKVIRMIMRNEQMPDFFRIKPEPDLLRQKIRTEINPDFFPDLVGSPGPGVEPA